MAQLDEKHIEDMIAAQPEILSSDWMLIGRQEKTPFGGIVDLLAVAPDGSLVLIEIKRGKTPREVCAQALDYASWVKRLGPAEITAIYNRYSHGVDLATAFKQRFGVVLDESEWNQTHQIVIVAGELDGSTERIAEYLSDAGVPINTLCFQVFEHKGEKLLSRAWLVDPNESLATGPGTVQGNEKLPWNGEYYVSYGAFVRGMMPAASGLSAQAAAPFTAELCRCSLRVTVRRKANPHFPYAHDPYPLHCPPILLEMGAAGHVIITPAVTLRA